MPVFDLRGLEISKMVSGDLAVVMPVYNESENICRVVAEWCDAFRTLEIRYTFLLIDDGSVDKTLSLLGEMEAGREDLVVVTKPNSGHGRSCRLGYNLCAGSGVPWVLQIDSDGQCDPRYFREFWEKRKGADCVFGVRTKRDDGWARSLTSKICRWSATLLCGVDLVDPNVPYRLLRREVLQGALKFIPSGFDIHNVALTFVLKKKGNKRWEYVPICFRKRQGSSNSINLVNVAQLGFAMLFDLLKLRKSMPFH